MISIIKKPRRGCYKFELISKNKIHHNFVEIDCILSKINFAMITFYNPLMRMNLHKKQKFDQYFYLKNTLDL